MLDAPLTADRPPTAACELTVLMPCLDEAETIGICIEKAMAYIAGRKIAGEVLIADNGSTDGSQDIARALGCGEGTVKFAGSTRGNRNRGTTAPDSW